VPACLAPEGIYVVVGDLTGRGVFGVLARVVRALALSRFVRQALVMFLARPTKEDLTILRDLLRAGTVRPVIDRRYSLRDVPEALRYLEQRHARGKVVISVSDSDAI
jgi:NADPH:quinone reductase-like Zn-dependent oxidoreductase